MTGIRDRAAITTDLAVAIIAGAVAAYFLATNDSWFTTGLGAAFTAVASVHLGVALWETACPESLSRKAETARYQDLIDELQDRVDEQDNEYIALINERDDLIYQLEQATADTTNL